MEQTIFTAGIDVGTTTTQVVFSRLTLRTVTGFGMAPRTEIVRREVVWKSPAAFTPLAGEEIDGAGVAALVAEAYAQAGFTPADMTTGAVIVTGESARRRNAPGVVQALAGQAGDFVVAAAGPDLESLLAGRGAGADRLSLEGGPVLNIDVGGGTANFARFENGKAADTACYNVGGRLLRLEGGRAAGISPRLAPVLAALDLPLRPGDEVTFAQGEAIAAALAQVLAEGAGLAPMSPLARAMVTNHGLAPAPPPERVTISGGVGACMAAEPPDPFAYGDLGVLLARAIRAHPAFRDAAPAGETLRATVIGAGACSMTLSGSTIDCRGCPFPLKNLPVLRGECVELEALPALAARLGQQYRWLDGPKEFAVALDGPVCPSFPFVEGLAQVLAEFYESLGEAGRLHPVAVEHDFGKALGQALRRRLPKGTPVLCIDGVPCREGDYLDLGAPLPGGAVPVMVKTLLFSGDGRNEQ